MVYVNPDSLYGSFARGLLGLTGDPEVKKKSKLDARLFTLPNTLSSSSFPELQWGSFMNPQTVAQIRRWVNKGGVIQDRNTQALKEYQATLPGLQERMDKAQAYGMKQAKQIGLKPEAWKEYLTNMAPAHHQAAYKDLSNQYNAVRKGIADTSFTLNLEKQKWIDTAVARGLITGVRNPYPDMFDLKPEIFDESYEPSDDDGFSLFALENERNHQTALQELNPEYAKQVYNRTLYNFLGDDYDLSVASQDPVQAIAQARQAYVDRGQEFPNLQKQGGSAVARAMFPDWSNRSYMREIVPDWNSRFSFTDPDTGIHYKPGGAPSNLQAGMATPESALLLQTGLYNPSWVPELKNPDDPRYWDNKWSLQNTGAINPYAAQTLGLNVRQNRYRPVGDTGNFYGGLLLNQTDRYGEPVMSPREGDAMIQTKGEELLGVPARYAPYQFNYDALQPTNEAEDYLKTVLLDKFLEDVAPDRADIVVLGAGDKSLGQFRKGPTDRNVMIAGSGRTSLSESPALDDLNRRDAFGASDKEFGYRQNQELQTKLRNDRNVYSRYISPVGAEFMPFNDLRVKKVKGGRFIDEGSTEMILSEVLGSPFRNQVQYFTPDHFSEKKPGYLVQNDTQPGLIDADTGTFYGFRWRDKVPVLRVTDDEARTTQKDYISGWIPQAHMNPWTGEPSAPIVGMAKLPMKQDMVRVRTYDDGLRWDPNHVLTNRLYPITERVNIGAQNLATPESIALNNLLREQDYQLFVPDDLAARVKAGEEGAAKVQKRIPGALITRWEGGEPWGWEDMKAAENASITSQFFEGIDPRFGRTTSSLLGEESDIRDELIAQLLYDEQRQKLHGEGQRRPTEARQAMNVLRSQRRGFGLLPEKRQGELINNYLEDTGGFAVDTRQSPLMSVEQAKLLNTKMMSPQEFSGDKYFIEDLIADKLEGQRLSEQVPDKIAQDYLYPLEAPTQTMGVMNPGGFVDVPQGKDRANQILLQYGSPHTDAQGVKHPFPRLRMKLGEPGQAKRVIQSVVPQKQVLAPLTTGAWMEFGKPFLRQRI